MHCVQLLLVLNLSILCFLDMLLLTFQFESQLIDLLLPIGNFSAILFLKAHIFEFNGYFLIFRHKVFLVGSDRSSDILCSHHIVVAF